MGVLDEQSYFMDYNKYHQIDTNTDTDIKTIIAADPRVFTADPLTKKGLYYIFNHKIGSEFTVGYRE